MSVSIINIKDSIKFLIFLISVVFIIVFIKTLTIQINKKNNFISFEKSSYFFSSIIYNANQSQDKEYFKEVLKYNYPIFTAINNTKIEEINNQEEKNVTNNELIINKDVNIENVTEKNIEESYNYTYDTVKIKNQSDYNLTEEMFYPNSITFKNKKIIIYHTHTCESYTPSEKYNYTMTGNYRTTDLNYSVARVGEELKNQLINKGFNVIHDTTYHDYPSYNGSYDRSFNTVENIIKDNLDTEIIIDLHRDAVGDGSWYGPTIKINSQNVAQMMFVIRYRWRRVKSPQLERKL